MKNWPVLTILACILLCQLAGVIGVLTSPTGNSPWYQSLNKPTFNPLGWIFGPVWSILYTMMGVSLGLLLLAGWSQARWVIPFFAAQLILNALWSPVFFRWHEIGWALAVIITMELLIFATISRRLAHLTPGWRDADTLRRMGGVRHRPQCGPLPPERMSGRPPLQCFGGATWVKW